jgi:hypothetical protein
MTQWSQEVLRMARKLYLDEDALNILRKVDLHLHDELTVVISCRKAGISSKTSSRIGHEITRP